MQQIDGNVIQPRIVGGGVGIKPIYVLLAITIGGGLFGFWGIVLGVPFMAVALMLLQDFIAYRNSLKVEPSAAKAPPEKAAEETPPDRERVPNFEEYPFCIPAVRALEELAFHEAVTFFVGENGTGKSTLLEAIAVACGFCPEGGGRNFQVETRATHSPLWRYLLPLRGPLSPRDGYFLRAESFYNVATAIDELDRVPAPAPFIRDAYGGSPHACSHGESFFALLHNRLGGNGLYLFDEPEAALSTHSPILLAYPDSRIYQLDRTGIRPIAYEEAEAVRITRAFLSRPEQTVRQLLQAEENRPPSGE